MRYVMRQKILSLADNFTIKDEQERDVYVVKGKLFSFGDKLSFQDTAGNELVYIDQRLLNWGPTYELWRGAELLAVVKRELFSFIHHRFTVDVPGPNDLEAEGDFLDHEYTFDRGGNVVATVSKRWFSWTDTYGIEIAEGEDPVLVLASAVVVDMVCHDDSKRR
ncbi:MAG TPA: LURP-one-related family protein [Gemmatimonadaceae bacterium]|nr:LURP-one-related family protein [Gemmatimonadaceae bacterium]